jgi:hypothetical protein
LPASIDLRNQLLCAATARFASVRNVNDTNKLPVVFNSDWIAILFTREAVTVRSGDICMDSKLKKQMELLVSFAFAVAVADGGMEQLRVSMGGSTNSGLGRLRVVALS